jgi:leucyl aminopeptidase
VIDIVVRESASADVLALGLGPDGPILDGLPPATLAPAARTAVAIFAAESGPAGAAGEVRELPLPGQHPRRVLLAATGSGEPDELRTAGAGLARAAKCPILSVAVPGLAVDQVAALVEGLALGAYRFSLRTAAATEAELATVEVLTAGPARQIGAAIDHARTLAAATVWARDLANARSSIKTPDWLGRQAAAELTPLGVRVDVYDETWLSAQGFGGVLAVGGGSGSPPRLIQASWRPRRAGSRHIVIIGKGITFDSGGLNLKPGDSMRTMYTDMAGGAAALGAMQAVAARRLPVRLTVLVPAAENSLSGSAMRPSDVIRHYGGRTTEVQNTDAEGRLVLADALAYAVDRLRPTALVDLATLTGAMKVALGLRTGGLLSPDDDLAAALLAAGAAAGEPLWRMPLVEENATQLDSIVADAQNAPGNPGGITAALFLRPFVGSVPWAHLDIAGPARATANAGVLSQGATGFGTRLLVRWIEAQTKRAGDTAA